ALATVSAVSVAVLSCSDDSLLKIDVDGDATFSNVSLHLSVKGTSVQQAFGNATFGPGVPYKVGLYLADLSGTVMVSGEALRGTCSLGTGTVTVMGVVAGKATTPAKLTIHASGAVC